jgi:hypothetical protein
MIASSSDHQKRSRINVFAHLSSSIELHQTLKWVSILTASRPLGNSLTFTLSPPALHLERIHEFFLLGEHTVDLRTEVTSITYVSVEDVFLPPYSDPMTLSPAAERLRESWPSSARRVRRQLQPHLLRSKQCPEREPLPYPSHEPGCH